MMKSQSVLVHAPDVIMSGQWLVCPNTTTAACILLYLTQMEVIVCIFFDLLVIKYNDTLIIGGLGLL